MVRRVTLHSHIEFVQPQAAFSFLFGDDRFVKRYHKEVNEDPNAEVSSWTADGRRYVRFVAPLNAPAVVKKLVGSELLKVVETQSYSRSGNCFRITSDPTIEITGGERFSTVGEIILEPGKDEDGTYVTINLVLEFRGSVWGVQGTVESYMEGQAKNSFKGWMKMAMDFCEEELAYATKSVHSIDEEEAEFYDPEDMPADETSSSLTEFSPRSPVHRAMMRRTTTTPSAEHGLEVWFVNAVMRELNGIQITTKAAKSHLEKLNSKMQKLEGELLFVRNQLERQNGLLLAQRSAWGLIGLGVATGVLLGIGHLCLRRRQAA